MENTVNTNRDAAYYDNCGYQRGLSPLTDMNALYRGFRRSMKGSSWKASVQQFETDFLSELIKLQDEIIENSYTPSPTNVFTIRERGKTRIIKGEKIRDRCVKHVLCDDVLMPLIQPRLIYDNAASLKDKGVSFTRKRLVCHLQRYYHEHGNEGYILLTDFSKFYDNILHDKLKQILLRDSDDEIAKRIVDVILACEQVDVSFLTDSEYSNCLNTLFDSLEYAKIPGELKSSQKFMAKHMDIGDQLAQIAGISYPMEIDNYIKIVCGIKYYARYMDDSYIIHHDRKYLNELKYDLMKRCADIGITIHERKTRICKLSDYWRFLQIQYSLTDTGRIIRKINPVTITRMRRKMKKIYAITTDEVFNQFFFSWYRNYRRYMSHRQKQNIMQLYNDLRRAQFVQN